MKERISKWLTQWNDLASRSVSTLQNLLDAINTRRLPKQHQIDEAKKTLTEIQIQADELVPLQSLLDEIAPITSSNATLDEQISAFIEWIESSEIKLTESVPILKQFAKVVGKKEPYDQEISPFRNRAIEMLFALNEDINPILLKQHLTWVENFRLFLEAIQLNEDEMNEKSELIDEIIPTTFSRFITKGIILGMYYVNQVENSNIDVPKITIDPKPTEPIVVEPIQKPMDFIVPSPTTEEPMITEPSEPSAEPIIVEPIPTLEDPILPALKGEESIVVEPIEPPAESPIELPCPKIIHNTRGGIGPKAFKSDLGEAALPYRIFHSIALLTVSTFDQLLRFIQAFSKEAVNKESVQKQIEKMIRKGHLMEYELGIPDIHFLGVSSASRMLLFKELMQSKWSEVGVLPISKPTHLPDIEITDIETLEHINHASEGFIRLMEWIIPKQNANFIKQAPELFSKETTHFLATSPKKEEEPESTSIVYAEECIDHPLVQKLVQDYPDRDVLLTIPFSNQENQPKKEWNRSWTWPNRLFVYDHEPIRIGIEPLVPTKIVDLGDPTATVNVVESVMASDPVSPTKMDSEQDPILNQKMKRIDNNENHVFDQETLIEKGSSSEALREVGEVISNAIVHKQFSEAVVLSKALSFIPPDKGNEFATLHQWLAHATGIHLESAHYTSHFLGELESKSITSCGLNHDFIQALVEASYLRAVIAPEARYDYGLASYAKHMAEESKTGLGSVFFKMEEVLGKLHQGYTRSILKVLKASQEKVSVQESIKKKALEYLSKPNNDIFVGMERFNIECFGNNSELYKMLSVVSRDDEKGIPEIEQLFHQRFGQLKKDGGEISFQIQPDLINAYIDQTWHHVRKHEMELRYRARDTVFNNIERRLEVIQDWMESKSQKKDGIQENIPFLIQKRQELLSVIQKAKKEIASEPLGDATSMLLHALQKAYDYLDHYGNIDLKQDFVTFFQTPYLVMDEFKVKLMPKLQEIIGQEPWRLVLKHMQEKKIGLEQTLLAIDNPKNELWYNNYGQYEQIHILLYPDDADLKLAPTKSSAKQWAEKQFANFRSGVEMARAYYRIDENLENRYLQYAEAIKSDFYDFDEYGKYRQVLKSIEGMIQHETQTRKLEFLNRIDTYEKDDKINLIYKDTLISARKWTESENFSVAEEYLSGVGNGGQFTRIDDVLSLTEKKYNEKYLSLYQSHLLTICKGSSGKMLRNWGYKAIEDYLPKEWTNRQSKSSEELLVAWSSSRTNATTPNTSEKAVQSLLSKLGLTVSGVKFQPLMSKKNDIFEATTVPSKKQKMDYSHPISTFGTHLDEKVPVIYVFGNHGSTEILSDLNEMQLRTSAIVIIDAPLSLQVRREIAERIKTQQASLVRPFLIIDQTLILYLATLDESERMLALLQCTMPYLNVQPFVNGAGAIPDEMFIGRKQELSQILSNDGPSILYGGRQLGKSALLHRAKSIKHDPERQSYAIYIDARNQKTKGLLKQIIEQFRSEKLISKFTKEELDYDSVFADIKQSFVRGSISELALYIDEADAFFEDFSKVCGRVLSIFLNLKRETHGKFRFLFAGLHNVMRFGNNMRDNSVLPQLGQPLCITPLSTADAYKLIEMPLTYLGYHLNPDQMALILANSLYFPGILHLIGYSIINATKGLYLNGIYSAANNPPYQINDASLQSIFYQEKINHEIEQKLEITLGLDQRYKKIAVIIAYLYHTEKAQIQEFQGFSMDRIKRFAEVEGLKLISDLSNTDLQGLLTEMKDMGILQADPGTQNYRFRKNSFRDIIAATEEIAFAKLLSVSEEETSS